jgi:hypothetical protein
LLGELTAAIGEGAEFFERQVIEAQGFGLVYALAVPNSLQKLVQGRVVNHL